MALIGYDKNWRRHVPDHEYDGSWSLVGFQEWLIKKRMEEGKKLYPFQVDEGD